MAFEGYVSPAIAERRKLDWRLLRRAWLYARPERSWFAAHIAALAASSLLAVLPPLVLRRLFDVAIPLRDTGLVEVLVGQAVVLYVASAVASILAAWFAVRVSSGLIRRLRVDLFDRLQQMPLALFTNVPAGAIQSRIINDAIVAQQLFTGQMFTGNISSVLAQLMLLIFTVGAMVSLSWRITVLTLVAVPAFIWPTRWVGTRLQRLTREQMTIFGEMVAFLAERLSISGAFIVKLFGRRDEERSAMDRHAAALQRNNIRVNQYAMVFMTILSLLGTLGFVAVHFFGALLALSGAMSVGSLVALVALVQRVYAPVIALASSRVSVQTSLVAFDRVFDVLDAPDMSPPRGTRALPEGPVAIEFRGVCFRYPTNIVLDRLGAHPESNDTERDWVLTDVTFSCAPGTMTALVGPSGAGKTTIALLLASLYKPDLGDIEFAGASIIDYTAASLSRAVSFVTQDVHLFNATVADNLRYARPTASEGELRAACVAARIAETIDALPMGFDTLVGERGYRLSGGEKQRLALARAVLQDPSVLILDEATAHLDSETEALVQEALDVVARGRTVIVIAHRLATVRAADQILVCEGGGIVESGTQQDLLAKAGRYASLYRHGLLGSPQPADPIT